MWGTEKGILQVIHMINGECHKMRVSEVSGQYIRRLHVVSSRLDKKQNLGNNHVSGLPSSILVKWV